MQTKADLLEKARRDFDSSIIAIDAGALQLVAAEIAISKISSNFPSYSYVNPEWSLQALAGFWLFGCAQSFKFWVLTADKKIQRYEHKDKTGNNAMLFAIKEAWRPIEWPPVRNIEAVFSGSPMTDQRIAIADELMLDSARYQKAVSLIIDAASSGEVTAAHAAMLADIFPLAFGDNYLKKAQFAVAAIAGCVQEMKGVRIHGDLTAFADYQVPRVLRALGILRYSSGLENTVDNLIPIESGGGWERCIRAATILAVEDLAMLSKKGVVMVDNMLWQSQKLAKETPFHLTETTAY